MITSQQIFWVYKDGVPVKRLSNRRACDEYAADLRVQYPESKIIGKHTELREQVLFEMAPYIQHQVKETNDA